MADLIDRGREVLMREAAFLDERRWDEWLALFAEDCEYWVPAWRTEDELTSDPQAEISHVYYASRAGLEDRVVRIRSDRSPATMPMRRTAHMVGNVLLTEGPDESGLGLRSSWTSHVYDPRHKKTAVLFGYAHYRLRCQGSALLIARKKTVIQSDYLPSMVDVYCI